MGAAGGLTERDVREHEYTRAAVPSGLLLAWRGRPLRRWDLALPADVRLARHGYTEVSGEQLRQLGLCPRPEVGEAKRQARRVAVTQGQEANPEVRAAVEAHAIKLATAAFMAEGWTVRDRGQDRLGYDLVLTRAGRVTWYAEVKGSTGGERAVRVTPGEVRFACEHPGEVVLYVVQAIVVEQDLSGQVRCQGGTAYVEDPWPPSDERLTPLTLRYEFRCGQAAVGDFASGGPTRTGDSPRGIRRQV